MGVEEAFGDKCQTRLSECAPRGCRPVLAFFESSPMNYAAIQIETSASRQQVRGCQAAKSPSLSHQTLHGVFLTSCSKDHLFIESHHLHDLTQDQGESTHDNLLLYTSVSLSEHNEVINHSLNAGHYDNFLILFTVLFSSILKRCSTSSLDLVRFCQQQDFPCLISRQSDSVHTGA